MNNDFKIIYICKKKYHLIMLLWSLQSLQKFNFNFDNIIIITSNEKERKFIKKNFKKKLNIIIINVEISTYPKFSYKPFVLNEINKYNIALPENILISDTDVLWINNPDVLFKKIHNKTWFHKITEFYESDYLLEYKKIKKSNIGLRTIKNYLYKHNLKTLPNFIVNAGLFSLTQKHFYLIIDNWFKKIKTLESNKMLMSEALLSLTLAELKINPYCDEKNIKYFGKNKIKNYFSYKILEKNNTLTGYEIVSHFFGKKRLQILRHILFSKYYTKRLIFLFLILHFFEIIKKKLKN